MSQLLLQNKVALITGASRGIGRAIAETFAQHGAAVAFTYISDSSAEKALELETHLQNYYGIKAKAYQSNAASFSHAEALVNNVLAEFGTIDILVNNAGITRDNLMLRMTETQWDDVMNNNLKSVFKLTKQVLRPMLKAKMGSIINLSSIVGMRGNAGQANYAATKAGVIGFTKSVAQELGSRNIRCNAIAPGFIETEMTHTLDEKTKADFLKGIPMQRYGKADEVANVALFLASDLATYVSGQTISVCGALNC